MCNCISEVETKLKETGRNTKLDIPITFSLTGKLSADRVSVATCKRDEKKREKPLRLFAAFCPFCGECFESEEAVEQSVHLTAFGAGWRGRLGKWLVSLGNRIAQDGGK